jgi:hypothetical protein
MVLFSRVALASEDVLDRQRDIARRALHLVVGQVAAIATSRTSRASAKPRCLMLTAEFTTGVKS